MMEYFTEQRDIGWSESKKYTATTEANVETVQQEKGTVGKKMSQPLFSFFRMTLVCGRKDEARLIVSTGFKREVRIANILIAIFLNQHDFTKIRLLEPAAILTFKLFINSQKSNMQ